MLEKYISEIDFDHGKVQKAINSFIEKIGAKKINEKDFEYKGKKFHFAEHPFEHSNDIIIEEKIAPKYDYYVLIKTGSNKAKIPGWTSKEELMKIPPRDIYRNGGSYYVVMYTNIKDLQKFRIEKEKTLLLDFSINQEKAENLGRAEMTTGILAGIHYFAKKADLYYKDINTKDECVIGNKKIKIYTRDAMSDEDMLVYESYFRKHPEIDIYVLCKIKGGKYDYLGYITKEKIEETRKVKMIGQESDAESNEIRRIFSDQYIHMSKIIPIYEYAEEKKEIIIKQKYVPLHVHSEFSIGDGYGQPEYIAEQARKKGFQALALTDHGTLAGVLKFQRAMLEKNLKPIIGCEFYVVGKEIDEKGKPKNKNHLTILAKNKKGWKNILELHKIAVDNFYYRPRLLLQELFKHKEGLIITSACMSGIPNKLILQKKEKEAKEHLVKMKQEFGEDYYIEIMPNTIQGNLESLEKMYAMAKEIGIKAIITTDAHYPNKEEKEMHEAIKAIAFKKQYGEAGFEGNSYYLMDDNELKNHVEKISSWMTGILKELKQNTFEIMEKINFKIELPEEGTDTLPKPRLDLYEKEFPEIINEFREWKNQAEKDPTMLVLSNHAEVENE